MTDLSKHQERSGRRRRRFLSPVQKYEAFVQVLTGEMSGEPQLAGSRITTQVAAALYAHIPDVGRIADLYAGVDAGMFEEAIEFERSLAA